MNFSCKSFIYQAVFDERASKNNEKNSSLYNDLFPFAHFQY